MRPAGLYSRPDAAHQAGDAVSACGDDPARKSERIAAPSSDCNGEDAIRSAMTARDAAISQEFQARAASLMELCSDHVRIDTPSIRSPAAARLSNRRAPRCVVLVRAARLSKARGKAKGLRHGSRAGGHQPALIGATLVRRRPHAINP